MSSSGYKRGLAYSAVTALAITGLPFFASTAQAAPLSDQAGGANSVDLATFDGDGADTVSTKNDGQNTTFRLEAVGGANVEQVRFEYSDAGGQRTTIATVSRNDDGAFMTEWAPAGIDGAAVTIYAVAIGANGNPLIGAGTQDSQAAVLDNRVETVNVDEGSQLGFFRQPYATEGRSSDLSRVTGTSSAAGVIDLNYWDGTQFVDGGDATAPTGGGAFAGTLDLTGYNYDDTAGATNQILVGADNNESDDSEAFALYRQQITTVTATADPAAGQSGSTSEVTVTVLDQNGNPVTGAQVVSSRTGAMDYTDENGQAQFTQQAGAANDAFYYANTTDNNAYEQGTDPRSQTVAVEEYAPRATSLEGNSENGLVFDENEYEANDIYVQVEDQRGNNFDPSAGEPQTLEYYWVFTPFDGGAQVRTPADDPATPGAETNTVATETNGRYNVPWPNNGTGTYELYAGLQQTAGGENAVPISKVLTVQAGDSEIVFDESSPEQATIKGSEEVSGSLQLVNSNVGLPNRPLTATTAGGPAQFDQATGADGPSRSTTTDANGNFSFTLDDPDASTTASSSTVTVVTDPWNDRGGDANDADESNSTTVDFVYSTTPGSVVIDDNGSDEDGESAGEVQDHRVTLRSQDDPNTPGDQSVLLANQEVTLTLNHGYFTDGQPTSTSAGSDAGTYDNDGQTITVRTNSAGTAVFRTSIGRDAGFDDDGDVTGVITATAGGASDTENQEWTSENPINAGSVDIEIAGGNQNPFVADGNNAPEDAQQNGADDVALVVRAFDQFGNRVGGETVQLTETGPGSVSGTAVTDYDEQSDATASSSGNAGQQTITASWTNTRTSYQDADSNPNTPATLVTDTETVKDTQVINWYTQEATNETVTLDDNTGGEAEPGETVTMTVTVTDQFGQPIQGYGVEFIRSGPSQQGGDTNEFRTTNGQGVATYNFTGTEEGRADITAVVRDRSDSQVATLNDVVVFDDGIDEVAPYDLLLAGDSNGKADDELQVNAPKRVEGALAKLFKIRPNGRLKLMAKQPLNERGNANFKVIDTNGRKFITYVAKVTNEDGSKTRSNNHKVR